MSRRGKGSGNSQQSEMSLQEEMSMMHETRKLMEQDAGQADNKKQ